MRKTAIALAILWLAIVSIAARAPDIHQEVTGTAAQGTENETLHQIPTRSELDELSSRITELEARLDDLETQQLANASNDAESGDNRSLPEPLILGTEITIQSSPYGMYVPPNSNIDTKLLTLACSIQIPNEEDQTRAIMYGYGQAVAWLTCGWLPGTFK